MIAICKKCGNEYPFKRREMGYTDCIDCSTQEKWSGAQVVHHKTGNEVEIIKDPEVAKDFAFKSTRKGFGTLQGMTSRRMIVEKTATRKITVAPPPPHSRLIVKRAPNTENFQDEEVAKEVYNLLDRGLREEAIELLNKEFRALRISAKSRKAILFIINN